MMPFSRQVCSVGQERRDSSQESFTEGADTAAAGNHQPERGTELLLSWMLCVRQREARSTEREMQSGEDKQMKFTLIPAEGRCELCMCNKLGVAYGC